MAHVYAILAANAANGAMPVRKDDELALSYINGFTARLCAQPLFSDQKFTARVVAPKLIQDARSL